MSCRGFDPGIKLHAYFNNLICDTILNWQTLESKKRKVHGRISFASKYLHFHAPLGFFIYDSVIREKLKEDFGFKGFRGKIKNKDSNPGYARVCEMLLKYASEKGGDNWTPRSIDKQIYGYDYQ